MTTINHALWGATFGRLTGMPIQGVLAGSMPDLLTVPILAVYHFQGRKKSSQVPKWAYNWYAFWHNWLVGIGIFLFLLFINQRYWVLGAAYLLHILVDAFVHTDYATRILFPLWKGKVGFYSASEHKWIQVVDIAMIIIVNIFISMFSVTF